MLKRNTLGFLAKNSAQAEREKVGAMLNRWWNTPSDGKLKTTFWLTVMLCVFMVFIRPVWNWVSPSGRDVTWSDVLTIQSAAAATLPQPVSNPVVSNAPAPASIGAVPAVSAEPVPVKAAPEKDASHANPAPASNPVLEQRQSSSVSPGPAATLVAPAAAKTEAELFGDQLQALSSLYESLITVLAVGLGLLAAIGFAAIRFASMREAENMARLVFDGTEHRAFVTEQIAKAVAAHWNEIASEFRDLQDRVYALSELLDEKVEPSIPTSVPAETRPPATPLPDPSATPMPTPSVRDHAAGPMSSISAAATPVPPAPPAGAVAVDVPTLDRAGTEAAVEASSHSAGIDSDTSVQANVLKPHNQTSNESARPPTSPVGLPSQNEVNETVSNLQPEPTVSPTGLPIQSEDSGTEALSASDGPTLKTATDADSNTQKIVPNLSVNAGAAGSDDQANSLLISVETSSPQPGNHVGGDQEAIQIQAEPATTDLASSTPMRVANADETSTGEGAELGNSSKPSFPSGNLVHPSGMKTIVVDPNSPNKIPDTDDGLGTGK